METKSLVLLCQEIIENLYADTENQDNANAIIDRAIGQLAEKVDSYVSFSKYLDAQTEFLDREIELLKNEKTKIQNVQKRLKERARYGLDMLDAQNLKGERGHMIYRRKTESVDVFDEKQLPEEFFRVEIKKTPNKEMIKSCLLAGETVPGARLVEGEAVIFK